MKKSIKILIIVFCALAIVEIPLYYTVHPTDAIQGYVIIKGNVAHPLNMSISDIQAMPSTTITARLTSSGSPQENGVFTYTGVTVWNLLQKAGVSDNATSAYVLASDAYGAVLTLKEIKSDSQIVLAYMQDGAMIKSQADGGWGPLRLVIGSDAYANRWVKWVVSITVT
jgi:DMSO/TMAO reductase YedYZ molybdopterin-dependent catalytic subunit